jgi:hypothetical protein
MVMVWLTKPYGALPNNLPFPLVAQQAAHRGHQGGNTLCGNTGVTITRIEIFLAKSESNQRS